MYEPKLVIISKETFEESIDYAKHIRNNEYFKDLPIIIISQAFEDNVTNQKKISNLSIKHFIIPVNTGELVKSINEFLS
ncbi:MAG: hypothetical protein KatS3mg068_1621 [Candidatus Sericytochromatia bacterium]|nr:MAG: hypothetical protein KatS3mg068_1621 [Candidatus Sericytochromatia bacterium]